MEQLKSFSYRTNLNKSLVNSLRKFDMEDLFYEIRKINKFYQENEILDEVDIDYRIKSIDSCLRKYHKFYPAMRVEKTFNDILGFRIVSDNYDELLDQKPMDGFRIVDMSGGKADDDGYRGVHVYYQPSHFHYPIEIQVNSFYDRQLNNWLHKYLYKRENTDRIGKNLRMQYEHGRISNEKEFREVLTDVLSNSQKI